MKSFLLPFMLIILLSMTSCDHALLVSEYSFDGRAIMRKDWDDVMTELIYYDRDGTEMGKAMFHYPGRDGWFLVDNIWDTDKMYLLLCDACPKISITDSAHFSVIHDIAPVQHIDKSRWIRISSRDDFPVVKKQNKEYNSKIKKINRMRQKCSNIPNWEMYSGEYFKE